MLLHTIPKLMCYPKLKGGEDKGNKSNLSMCTI